MKNLVSALIISVAALSAYAQDNMKPKTVPLMPENVYVPMGFDSNDHVEIAIEGALPNLCYQTPTADVKIDEKKREIDIALTAYLYPNTLLCAQMIVPFLKTVSLGILDKGDYKIFVNRAYGNQTKEMIKVTESVSGSVDEYIYAHVDYVEKDVAMKMAYLNGYNVSDCFTLDKIALTSNGKNTYSVRPIMKQTSEFCPRKMVPFRYGFKVPTDLGKEKVLLHVRSMEGKAVNSLFDFTVED